MKTSSGSKFGGHDYYSKKLPEHFFESLVFQYKPVTIGLPPPTGPLTIVCCTEQALVFNGFRLAGRCLLHHRQPLQM